MFTISDTPGALFPLENQLAVEDTSKLTAREKFCDFARWKRKKNEGKSEGKRIFSNLHKIFNDVTRKVLSAVIMIKLRSAGKVFHFCSRKTRALHPSCLRLIMTLINNK